MSCNSIKTSCNRLIVISSIDEYLKKLFCSVSTICFATTGVNLGHIDVVVEEAVQLCQPTLKSFLKLGPILNAFYWAPHDGALITLYWSRERERFSNSKDKWNIYNNYKMFTIPKSFFIWIYKIVPFAKAFKIWSWD